MLCLSALVWSLKEHYFAVILAKTLYIYSTTAFIYLGSDGQRMGRNSTPY